MVVVEDETEAEEVVVVVAEEVDVGVVAVEMVDAVAEADAVEV